jgi:UDP-galactopyranose mutase
MILPIDFVCLSHLRWNFVYQRPNHLMHRAARDHRVFFVEEPIVEGPARVEMHEIEKNLWRVVPHVEPSWDEQQRLDAQRAFLDNLFVEKNIRDYGLWYYTPMALPFSRHLDPKVVVFDCMDELSHFKGAAPILRDLETELLARSDVVFTGGQSLYEAKRGRHHNVHAFPSSIDVAHFKHARDDQNEPEDQRSIARPRLGYCGVIDERMDLALIEGVASAQPDWQIVMLGPVVKISEDCLPRLLNIHYLGMKKYDELPKYFAGWDVGLLPFAINDATKFISPTKTPEYLAAGLPVVSTPIRDVVRPYGELGMARIASTADEFVAAVKASLSFGGAERKTVDAFLDRTSWDRTWQSMTALVAEAIAKRRERATSSSGAQISTNQDGVREEEESCSTI